MSPAPSTRHVLEDSAWDTAAKSWDHVDFVAKRYRVPLAGAGDVGASSRMMCARLPTVDHQDDEVQPSPVTSAEQPPVNHRVGRLCALNSGKHRKRHGENLA